MVPQPRSADHELSTADPITTDSITTDSTTTAGHLTVRVQNPAPGTVAVRVRGEVDLGTAGRLDEVLHARIRPGVDAVVVDLSGVTFFSVAGLNSLLRAQLLADTAGARLLVEPGPSRPVRRLFALLPTDFDSVAARPIG